MKYRSYVSAHFFGVSFSTLLELRAALETLYLSPTPMFPDILLKIYQTAAVSKVV